jgi:DNA uptake protein ComE-like DNA-binding protein
MITMTTPTASPQPPGLVPTAPRRSLLAGRWYFLVTIASAGLLAWIPFLHAAGRLRRRSVRVLAAAYGAGAVALAALTAMTPTDAQGTAAGSAGHTMSAVTGLLAIAIIAVACVQQVPLRREAYRSPAARPAPSAATDPAVATALASRARRDEARELARRDPLMARELRIGRPDLARTFDDGGLVDLNTAPAAAIAAVCDLPPATADTIVAARSGGGFLAVDDVFSLTDVPMGSWDVIRDRGIVL